jgi:adenylate cyclase
MGKAIASGRLSLAFLDFSIFRWSGLARRTWAEVAAERGVTMELVQHLYEALGLPRPEPGDAIRDDDEERFPILQLALGAGVGEDAMARLLRVYGDSLRRITQAESQSWHAHIELPMLRAGISEAAMREIVSDLGVQMVPLLEGMILSLYRRYQERAWIEDLIEHVESALEEEGYARRSTALSTMCFLDLTGYTRLTEEQGDAAAAELAASLSLVVQGAAVAGGGLAVKWLGDGVMFHFAGAGPAVRSALEMVEATPRAGLPPAHVGLHTGPVVLQDGDYYGRTVNVAARVAGVAGPGQVLVTDEVVDHAAEPDLRFEPVGEFSLKGLATPVSLHQAMRVP